MTDPVRGRSEGLRQLRPHPSSVAEARRAVRAALTGASFADADALDTAELCVSELVTNAVVHAGTLIDVGVLLYDGGARIEVEDRSAHLPVPRHYASLASTGRGLLMVDQLVTRWGVSSHQRSKTVWFEIGAASDLPDDSDTGGGPSRALGVQVVLRQVPLLLHAAWQIHAESLLRELLLIRLDEESLDGLEEHAAASAAIALLEHQIRRPDLASDPAEVMAGAVEPIVSADEIVLEVPPSAVKHFAVLNRLLEDAASLADSGSLLTPPIQAEIRDFRRWVCQEVSRQSAGEEPATWDPAVRRGRAASGPPLEWDATEVMASAGAVIAADDFGNLVAVSEAAARALGYPDAQALVGGRLVDVIPQRFRQAHLAGVTLHLFAGRGPLLDNPVTVPALCADGQELMVEVVVRSRRLPEGRRLFTADLTPV